MDKTENAFSIRLYLLRGAGIFLSFFAIKSLMSFFSLLIYTSWRGSFDLLYEWAVYLIIAVGDAFIYGSVTYLFTSYDRRLMRDFLAEGYISARFGRDMGRTLRSREFICEITSVVAFALIAFLLGGFRELTKVFGDTGMPLWAINLIAVAVLCLGLFWFGLKQRYEVLRRFIWLERRNNIQVLYSAPRLILKAVAIVLLYILVYPFAPMIIFAYLSIFGIFGALFDVLKLLAFLGIVALAIFFIFTAVALRSVYLRHKLIKQLVRVCADSGYELSQIKRPYASLFKWKKECNFTVKKGDAVFSCRIIGSFWQRAPMYFTSPKDGHFRHRIGSKEHHFAFLLPFEYDFEGEGVKLLILNPVPRRAFAAHKNYVEGAWYDEDGDTHIAAANATKKLRQKGENDTRRLEPGDKIWDYGIYNTTSFISAIDHDCLGRFNGMFE